MPKCAACVKGSGRRCSHTDLVLDIKKFRAYGTGVGSGVRMSEYASFFGGEPISVWGSALGLSIARIDQYKQFVWQTGLGQHLVSSSRYLSGVPQALLVAAAADDPPGERVLVGGGQLVQPLVLSSPKRPSATLEDVTTPARSAQRVRFDEGDSPTPGRRAVPLRLDSEEDEGDIPLPGAGQ